MFNIKKKMTASHRNSRRNCSLAIVSTDQAAWRIRSRRTFISSVCATIAADADRIFGAGGSGTSCLVGQFASHFAVENLGMAVEVPQMEQFGRGYLAHALTLAAVFQYADLHHAAAFFVPGVKVAGMVSQPLMAPIEP